MALVYRLSYIAMYINRIFYFCFLILCVHIVILTFERWSAQAHLM